VTGWYVFASSVLTGVYNPFYPFSTTRSKPILFILIVFYILYSYLCSYFLILTFPLYRGASVLFYDLYGLFVSYVFTVDAHFVLFCRSSCCSQLYFKQQETLLFPPSPDVLLLSMFLYTKKSPSVRTTFYLLTFRTGVFCSVIT